ncbi:MAG TPA: metallopeptidase TldD-related protein [bacterium]
MNFKNRRMLKIAAALLTLCALGRASENIVLKTLTQELNRSFNTMHKQKPIPMYFLQYEVWDQHQVSIVASLGAIYSDTDEKNRFLDIDVRVGSAKLDNTHEIRGGGFDYSDWMSSEVEVCVDDDPDALRSTLWIETDKRFKSAQEKYIKVQSERQVKVAESDTSADFSASKPIVFVDGQPAALVLDTEPWRSELKRLSSRFKEHAWIYDSQISLRALAQNKYTVNTDGTRILDKYFRYYVRVSASTMADDGMELYLAESFYATDLDALPAEEIILAKIDTLIMNLSALKNAPLVEPYSGPAILMNRACGVFFHEIFGHRIEGHRQKSEYEGQTFTKKINERIMPEFISIVDDPTMTVFGNQDLNGHYNYDDEGVAAQKAVIVEKGVLKGFLTSRSPIANFPMSNGHGRRSYGRRVVSRQGVLYTQSDNKVPFVQLRENLIEECKKQNKPYGLIFYDISGGYTMTGRESAQTFKVIPLLVKRVYVDGRPDEVVRGVDIVGTPLLSLSKIILTGDDYGIFNGTCGAESGWVPVSSISPSILVSEIEIEKKAKGQDKPPILPAPTGQPQEELP